MTRVDHLVIDRDKWLRGEGDSDSYLLRERDGKMCCVGQYEEQRGVPLEKLVGVDWVGLNSEFNAAHKRLVGNLAKTNDSPTLSERTREDTIARLFLELRGDDGRTLVQTVRFVGGVRP